MHVWLLVLTLAAAPVGGKDIRGVSSAKTAFERLTELAGDWENTAKKGPGPLRVQYKLTPNGRAVVETFDPGTAREMINVYHLDGAGRLFLIHYCALGNQPRMRFQASSLPDKIRFSFAGGTNLNPKRDRHLRWEAVRFLGDGSIESEYAYYQDGKRVGSNTLVLRRRK